uniref:Uncharacterized protein n=1 Tax=Oryza nivara TaxID=4536 RepID=A0A0E0GM76_ORYNI
MELAYPAVAVKSTETGRDDHREISCVEMNPFMGRQQIVGQPRPGSPATATPINRAIDAAA